MLAASALAAACGRAARSDPHVDFTWTLTPSASRVGPSTLTITLRNPDGRPLPHADVALEAHMSHPGMAPVLAKGAEQSPGVYEVPFAFTMQGDWALLVTAALADGTRVERRIDVRNVRPSG